LRRLNRWMMTGIAIPASPSSRNGFKKSIYRLFIR
jgi:hypothetical protein